MTTRRLVPVLMTAVLALPLLATTACSSVAPPDRAAPAASRSSSPTTPDQLGQMRQKVDAAERAADAADANGSADTSGG
ncbi:hypothetical protein [Streptomyces sp. NPDC048650]|uniref:hypothetical protein n=1 Tax=unclassified Streptomyces TaxID=2593676 RepID=UPI003714EEE6